MTEFIPFNATSEQIEARSVLRDGVPPSMKGLVLSWVRGQVEGRSGGYARMEVMRDIENNLDIPFGVRGDYLDIGNAMFIFESMDDDSLLSVVHYLLYRALTDTNAQARLGRILTEGRSRWTVGRLANRHAGLIERVPRGVQDAAEALAARGDAAGRLLGQAWANVHDFQPNDSAAYRDAIRAVEAAALPALGITSANATITHITRAIEARDSTWRLPFLREHTEYPSRDVLLAMLKSLYRGQRDRHGSEDYSDVNHDEALTAVLMAVTLVGLFSGGLVRERDTATYS